jgi:hypothetical protein
MGNTRLTHARHSSAPSEALPSALARVYARARHRYEESQKAAEPSPEPDGRNDAAIMRNTEEVSHVEQRLDRPSEIVVTHSRVRKKDS